MFEILAITGSVRCQSSNKALLEAACIVGKEIAVIRMCDSLASLPIFNPDLVKAPPDSVRGFQASLRQAHAVLIASPEYAHGITGALKNALDWVVESGEFVDKPVGLLNASSRATHAYNQTWEILSTMNAQIIKEASFTIPLPNNSVTADDILKSNDSISALKRAIQNLVL